VEDQDVITAGAVASSLDLGLYVCEKLVGAEAREAIRMNMDYPKMKVTTKKVTN
jgi:cyclohexyl-isocyanide hydratase